MKTQESEFRIIRGRSNPTLAIRKAATPLADAQKIRSLTQQNEKLHTENIRLKVRIMTGK